MVLPDGFEEEWPALPEILGADVVRRVLDHERVTRSDIRDAVRDVDLSLLRTEQLLSLVAETDRYSLVKSILTGFRTWRAWRPSIPQLMDVTIWPDIHYRVNLAPQTGTLREAGRNLNMMTTPNEFSEVLASWNKCRVDLGGLTAVWVKPNEIGLIEGCHRMIPLAALVEQNQTPRGITSIDLAVGRP